ncbi:MAG: ExbD/TolR family protein [Chthoniobacterales bacterium]|jgi:biopolymer transport protein ExbD
MRRYSDKQPLSTLSEINVTPLLDLAFVLLIIFMITTPLMENSMDLIVPSSEAASKEVDPKKVQMLSIDRNEVLKLNDVAMPPTEIEQRLATLRSENPATAVVVRPHRDLPVQQFIKVMDLVQRAGVMKVGVMTRPEED